MAKARRVPNLKVADVDSEDREVMMVIGAIAASIGLLSDSKLRGNANSFTKVVFDYGEAFANEWERRTQKR